MRAGTITAKTSAQSDKMIFRIERQGRWVFTDFLQRDASKNLFRGLNLRNPYERVVTSAQDESMFPANARTQTIEKHVLARYFPWRRAADIASRQEQMKRKNPKIL